MGDKTGIQWTDATWNPVTGCSKVSAGCKNCYAERVFPRAYKGREFTDVRCHPERLDQPLRWKRQRRVFVNSMSDLFHESVPDEFIAAVFGVAVRRPDHVFQILTKRPMRMLEWFKRETPRGYLSDCITSLGVTLPRSFSKPFGENEAIKVAERGWPLPNVWLGVSVEDQASADERIPILLQTPAAVRFLSVEPLLEPVNLTEVEIPVDLTITIKARINCLTTDDTDHFHNAHNKIDWVIVGGESGPHARPCNIEWIRSVTAQCKAEGVPVFVKQLGSDPVKEGTHLRRVLCQGVKLFIRHGHGGDPSEWPEDLRVREFPE